MSSLLNRALASYKLNKLRTWAHQTFKPCAKPRILFVFGCQRSGTTMLRDLIGWDGRVLDIGEGNAPYFHTERGNDDYNRLIPWDDVERIVSEQRSEIVLLKPLHDSQLAVKLLDRFPGSRGIWIHRQCADVVHSHMTYYKHDYQEYLKPLFQGSEHSWFTENLDADVLAFVRSFDLNTLPPADAYALFWFARNSLLFGQRDERLMPLSFDILVKSPASWLQPLSEHLGMKMDPWAARLVDNRSRARDLKLANSHIAEAVKRMEEQLAAVSQLP
jgi:hypothetical protein